MSLRGKKIMWKAADGKEFEVDTSNCDTMEDVQKIINKLRKRHGYEEPTFVAASSSDPSLDLGPYIHEDDIEYPVLRAEIKEVIRQGRNKPDPKTLN